MKFKSSILAGLSLAMLAVSSSAQANQLLVIEGSRFYPASGYPSAIGGQDVPGGYQRYVFRTDSGYGISGKATIRCRGGGGEFRDVALQGGGYGAYFNNPCPSTSQINFDLYLSSPTLGAGSYDRVRVYGEGSMGPGPGPGPGPGWGYDQLGAISSDRFYPAQGMMGIGGQDYPSGYREFIISSDRNGRTAGKLTIRCRGGKEYREIGFATGGYGSSTISNPCSYSQSVNMDIYLSYPQVGPGTWDTIRVLGRR